jgi:hypothetical protein
MIKTLLAFTGGIIFACISLIIIGRNAPVPNDDVLGASISVDSIQTQVKDKVQDNEGKGLALVGSIVPKILSAITENPILAPFMKTQKEVGEAVKTVKDLPGDQRNAICDQICSN